MRRIAAVILMVAMLCNGMVARAEPHRRIVLLDDVPLDATEQILLQNLCIDAKLDYRFVYGILWSESRFIWQEGDGNLEHSAIGYFQISTINQERMMTDYGLDIYEKQDNLEAGVMIIKELTEEFKDGYAGYDTETCVVMCYKCGINRGKELMKQGFVLDVVKVIEDMEPDFEL